MNNLLNKVCFFIPLGMAIVVLVKIISYIIHEQWIELIKCVLLVAIGVPVLLIVFGFYIVWKREKGL